jgi:predicted phosphodiesterase
MGKVTIEDVKKAVLTENPSIEDLLVRFGAHFDNHWIIRKARREALADAALSDVGTTEVINSSAFQSLSKQANLALRAGFFRPSTVVLKERPPVKPIFEKAGQEILVISDVHAPDHDPHAVDVVLQIGQSLVLDMVIINGDLFDVHALSRYTPAADRPFRFVDERAEALPVLVNIREHFPEVPFKILWGNHDRRPDKFIASKVPQLQGLFDLAEILGVSAMDVTVVEEGRILLANDKLLIKHGTTARQGAGYSVTAEMKKSGLSTIIGHTHRRALIDSRRIVQEISDSAPLMGAELGCLSNLRPDYLEAEDTADWQHGAAVVTVYDDGEFNIEPIRIHSGVGYFRGFRFHSRVLS